MPSHQCDVWREDITATAEFALYGIIRTRLVCIHGVSRWIDGPEAPRPARPKRSCAYCGAPCDPARRKCAAHQGVGVPVRERIGDTLRRIGELAICRVCGETFPLDHHAARTCLRHRTCPHCHRGEGNTPCLAVSPATRWARAARAR